MTAPDPFLLDLLRGLVACKSVNPPGDERQAAVLLGDALRGLGFAVEVQDIAPGRANMIARLAGGPGPEIALCGHLDVVAADPAGWSGDPFVLRREGGRLYGRGVCDMKGAIACMAAAAREFITAGQRPRGALTLLGVIDEEMDGIGSKTYLARGGRPDAVIIGEPTGMDVCVAHRGVLRYRLDISGRSGHAARPAESANAIYIAGNFVRLLEEHAERLAAARHPFLPPPSLAVTMIAAGEQPNTIPGRCRVTVDRRTLPYEDKAAIVREVEALRRRMPPRQAEAVGEPEFFIDMPAGQPIPGSTLGEECRNILAGMGLHSVVRDFPAGCDQFAFVGKGVDCVLVGPGRLAQAHTADEFVELEQLALAKEFYLRFIQERLT